MLNCCCAGTSYTLVKKKTNQKRLLRRSFRRVMIFFICLNIFINLGYVVHLRPWDAGQMMQDWRDAGLEGFRKGGIQERRDAGHVGCKTGEMQESRDSG